MSVDRVKEQEEEERPMFLACVVTYITTIQGFQTEPSEERSVPWSICAKTSVDLWQLGGKRMSTRIEFVSIV